MLDTILNLSIQGIPIEVILGSILALGFGIVGVGKLVAKFTKTPKDDELFQKADEVLHKAEDAIKKK